MTIQPIIHTPNPNRRLRHWLVLIAIAFGGSAFYGGSLAYALRVPSLTCGAAWLIVAAGLSWCVFGPVLTALTGQKPLACAHACLVTMAYGEAVLALGAVVNFASPIFTAFPAVPFNWASVGLSNVVMAAAIVRQFRPAGIPTGKTLAVWIIGLDGTGALLFWMFRGLLHGGH